MIEILTNDEIVAAVLAPRPSAAKIAGEIREALQELDHPAMELDTMPGMPNWQQRSRLYEIMRRIGRLERLANRLAEALR